MSRALYRVRQVLHALRPRIDQADIEFARASLSEAEAAIFFSMERRDQRHGIAVARRLSKAEDRSLLAAALLHDCGKGSVPVWLRVFNVVSPRALLLVEAEGKGWRGAAHRLHHHAALGAELTREAGSSETTVRLIQGHVEPDEAWMHTLLGAADDAS
jgi:hypothetical protein